MQHHTPIPRSQTAAIAPGRREIAQTHLSALRLGPRGSLISSGHFEILARRDFCVEQLLRAFERQLLACFIRFGLAQIRHRRSKIRRIDAGQYLPRFDVITRRRIERDDTTGNRRGDSRGEVLVVGDAAVERFSHWQQSLFNDGNFQCCELGCADFKF